MIFWTSPYCDKSPKILGSIICGIICRVSDDSGGLTVTIFLAQVAHGRKILGLKIGSLISVRTVCNSDVDSRYLLYLYRNTQ